MTDAEPNLVGRIIVDVDLDDRKLGVIKNVGRSRVAEEYVIVAKDEYVQLQEQSGSLESTMTTLVQENARLSEELIISEAALFFSRAVVQKQQHDVSQAKAELVKAIATIDVLNEQLSEAKDKSERTSTFSTDWLQLDYPLITEERCKCIISQADKITDLEWALENAKSESRSAGSIITQLRGVIQELQPTESPILERPRVFDPQNYQTDSFVVTTAGEQVLREKEYVATKLALEESQEELVETYEELRDVKQTLDSSRVECEILRDKEEIRKKGIPIQVAAVMEEKFFLQKTLDCVEDADAKAIVALQNKNKQSSKVIESLSDQCSSLRNRNDALHDVLQDVENQRDSYAENCNISQNHIKSQVETIDALAERLETANEIEAILKEVLSKEEKIRKEAVGLLVEANTAIIDTYARGSYRFCGTPLHILKHNLDSFLSNVL